MRTLTCLLPKVLFIIALGLTVFVEQSRSVFAQGDGVVPASYQSGNFFNQQLGTAFRFNFHTQGYGTQDDVFSLGAMKNFNLDNATVFVDGQGTLSNDFGGGFNLGVGYRQLATLGMAYDPERILGVGFWTDGQSTNSDNFFTQLGFSLESLGESYDLRLNGHFPLERTQASDAQLTGAGTPVYSGNNLFGAIESLTIDTAHTVIDGEFAKRITNLEIWAFAGGYHLGGGGVDTTGFRLGVRGYAVPDLALSLQVTDDNVYATNVVFGATWFIGRTTKNNAPSGTLLDRFREPVVRNDFIATSSRQITQASGNALTDNTSNEIIRMVHVNSNAAAGGDGTFENPYDQISDTNVLLAGQAGNTLEGDNILVHAGSTFAGADGQAVLLDNQRLLGEGVDHNNIAINHIFDTNELGLINLPETAAGSLALSRAIITGGGLDTFTLADNNTVSNFTINGNGAGTAITAGPDDLVADANDTLVTPILANLQINDVATAILLDRVSGTAIVENSVEINGASTAGINVLGGEDGMSIAATINDSTGNSLIVQNRTGGTVNYTGTIDDDVDNSGDFSDGILIANNADSTVNLSNTLKLHVDDGEDALLISNNSTTAPANSSIVNVSGAVDITATGTGRGVVIAGNDENTVMTIADLNATAVNGNTVDIQGGGAVTISSADNTRVIANTGTGTAVLNRGDVANADNNALVAINSDITNAVGGLAIDIQDRLEKDVTIAGDVTVSDGLGGGVLVNNVRAGNILFTGKLDLDTGASNAVLLTNNEDAGNNTEATLSFSDLDLETSTGQAFTATGGGNLIVTSANGTNNILVTGAGSGLNLNGMTIDSGNVVFDKVDVSGVGTLGINLTDLAGTGSVNIGGGTNPADGGTLTTTGTAIVVDNANNVQLTNLTVSNAGANGGVSVTNQATGSSATFAGLNVNTVNADAVNVSSNADGTITFTDLTAATSGTGGAVVINNNVDATVSINGMEATATGSGVGFRATGTGNLTVSGDTSVTTATGQAVEIDGQTIVTGASFDTVTAVGAANGVTLKDVTGALVTIGSGSNPGDGGTLQTTGTAITVDNVESVAINRVLVDNDSGANIGAGLLVTNQATGSSFTSNELEVRTTTAAAVTVNGNADGTIAFTDVETQTTDGAGITVTSNGIATTSFNGLEVTATGSGAGFTASGGGTLVATGTNNVTTVTGTGVSITNTTIGGAGVNFATVDVNGATNAVVLDNLTGGQVTIGGAATASTMTTTGDAIAVTNAANVNLNNIDITSGGDALVVTNNNAANLDVSIDDVTVATGGSSALLASHTGAGDYTLNVTNSVFNEVVDYDLDGAGVVSLIFNDTDVTTLGTDVAITLLLDNAVANANVQIRNSDFVSANAVAFDFDANSTALKTVTFELSGSTASNNSAGSISAELDASGQTLLGATITGNTFTNSGAGANFDLAANNNSTVINLLMTGNVTNNGTDSVTLRELGTSDFNIVDRVNFESDNGGVNTFIYDSAGNVIGDFDDIPVLP